jgi:hypothetical protein
MAPARLRSMLAAGERVQDAGAAILHHMGTKRWVDYPKGHGRDAKNFCAYYFHIHRGRERGHFHLFVLGKGIPKSMRPVAHPAHRAPDDVCAHLISIMVDSRGRPTRLFTINRWASDESWYKAADVNALLGSFRLDHAEPRRTASEYLPDLLCLFRPQIEELNKARDAAVEAWQKKHPDQSVYEDKRLEIITQTRISLGDQLRAVREALRAA